jgi:sulfatase modifying factor 1
MNMQKLMLIIFIILLTGAPASAATVVSWANAGSGLWSESAKWSPVKVPDQSDDVYINGYGSVTITVITTAASKTLTVGGDKKITLSTGQLTISTGDYTSANIGTLKYVPAGSFQRDGTPANISTVTTSFRMSQYEITQAQYVAVTTAANPSLFIGETLPVEQVTWYDAVEFCNDLSTLEGFTPVNIITNRIPSDGNHPITSATVTATWTNNGYRLPTEMEWMWAAMGATSGSGWTSPTYLTGYGKLFAGSNATNAAGNNGTNVIGDYAWYDVNSPTTTHPVGTAGTTGHPNELGLYDMSGNVFEWVWDWHAAYPAGALASDTDAGRGAASGTFRVMRGGTWSYNASYAAVASRVRYTPDIWSNAFGFRVVRP